ncbi:MAG: carboxypeptidase regulatory-like domain-containing protein, partial [candidate division Zixibacteria bacterium]|nr:carboxypeptidase regulatory-like domain-containing protein [candidate division Zixibacteria bacterium]
MSRQYLIWLFVLIFAFSTFAGDEFQSGGKQNIDEGFLDLSEDTTPSKIALSLEDDNKSILGDMITEIPGSIAGAITNESSGFINNVYVFVNKTNITDNSNSSGEYLLEGVDVGANDVCFILNGYRDTVVTGVTVVSGETTTLNVMMRDDSMDEVIVWYGNLNSSPMELGLGERFDINAYIQTRSDITLGFLLLSLGAEDQYIDSLLSATEGEFYYPLSDWQFPEFQGVYGSPPNPEGWSSQAFLGWARITPDATNPYLHLETPTQIIKFVMKTANDVSNMGHMVHGIGKGIDPFQGPSISSDTTGDNNYPVTEHFSPLYFPGDDITGTVTNQNAQPLENVYAEIIGGTRDDYSNSSGVYLLNDLLPGYYDLRFSYPGAEDQTFDDVRVYPNQTTYLNVTMTEYGALDGVVINPDLEFIEGVLVTVLGTGQSELTDENGEYLFGQLDVDDYTVTFTHPDYFNQTRYGVSVLSGDTTQLNVEMPYLGAIDGVVEDFWNAPINNVNVVLNGQGMNDYTNPAGEFFIGSINPGTYSITLTHADYNQKTVGSIVVNSAETTSVDVTMDLLAVLEGIVTKTDGSTLLDGVLIRLLDGGEVDRDTTNVLGFYQLTHLQAGFYDIEVSKDGYVTQSINNVQVFYNQIVTRDILLVEDIGSIAGIVNDGRAPIEGALVSTVSDPYHDLTDVAGEYELADLPTGYYDLKISKAGYEDAYFYNVEVLPEQVTTRNATLDEKPFDVAISLFSDGFYRPGLDGFYSCQYRNEGSTAAANVVVVLDLPGEVTYLSSDPAGSYSAGAVTWTLGGVAPGTTEELWVAFNVPGGVSVGTMLEATALITTDSPDPYLLNNYVSYSAEVVSSWDAFDKLASPAGYGTRKFIADGKQLAYNVFFENETGGAATVADIVVTDTLDEDIDLSTLVLGPVSHSLVCSTHIDYAKAVLTWTFTSIALPDNNTPPEGEGFVCYGARTYQPILNETEITNRAAVKFDSDPWELCPEYEPLLRTIDKQAPVSEVNSLPSLVI